jgi:hypothetical protein
MCVESTRYKNGRYQTTFNAYVRLDKAVSVTLCACSVGSLVITSSNLGSALTGTGVKATLPLGFLSCLNAITVMDLTLFSRHVTKKTKKHHDTLRLTQSKKSLVEQCVRSALADDDQIDDEEFDSKTTTTLKIRCSNPCQVSARICQNASFRFFLPNSMV